MTIEIKDFDQVLEEYQDKLQELIPTADISENSNFNLVAMPLLYAIAGNYSGLAVAVQMLYIQCAVGEGLDGLASNYGIYRKDAVKATGYLNFVGTNGTTIPLGTTVQNDAGIDEEVLQYVTTELININSIQSTGISFNTPNLIDGTGFTFSDGDIILVEGSTSNDGVYTIDTATTTQLILVEDVVAEVAGPNITISVIAPCESKEGGEKYNVPVNTITEAQTAISGVESVSNPTPMIGGIDQEADGEKNQDPDNPDTSTLRGRLIENLRRNKGKTTKTGYEETILNVEGVASVVCVNYSTNPPRIFCYIASSEGNGVPSPALLADTLDEVTKDENKDPLDTVTTHPFTPITIDATYNVDVLSGYVEADVLTEIENNLIAYITDLGIGEDVLLIHIDNVVHDTPGVENFTRSLPIADIAVAGTEKAIAGTITIT